MCDKPEDVIGTYNHRVIEAHGIKGAYYFIGEVYYNKDGKPMDFGYASLRDDSLLGLSSKLAAYTRAVNNTVDDSDIKVLKMTDFVGHDGVQGYLKYDPNAGGCDTD
jgi:hypothetical protein